MHPKDLAISNFTYQLPNEKIAAFPLVERDASKLLVYKDGIIQQDVYRNIASHIPPNSLLVFNNTKVIQARILFQKDTGGVIEIFCLEPFEEAKEYNLIMNKKGTIRWKCMIGGAGKWKNGSLKKQINLPQIGEITLSATLVQKLSDAYIVKLSWLPAHYTFAEVLDQFGDMPLPPYIKRKADLDDKERYQTIYAQHQGSVAAPTAGLHFTGNIFESFTQKTIAQAYVTLHVGAGTFKPVKAESMLGHEMHSEWMDVSIETIKQLIDNTESTTIAVGTTSLRTIESLYWMGVKAKLLPQIAAADLMIKQWDVYELPLQQTNFTCKEALQSLLHWMEINNLQQLFLPTQILIAPGYQYKVAQAIITNFHQPQSTLLLLVAAAVGDDWKKIYDYALENDFRFLSYGDGSLLFCASIP
jgi:S-adenosylmethionine:tRNA ribosyltransferase-isomerase